MTLVVFATVVLLAGAILALLPVRNSIRAALSIGSQVIANVLVLATAIPVLLGGEALSGRLSWAYPVGAVEMSLDPLGAFFLSWSLPMTLIGSIYAAGYLRQDFDGERNVGVHYALLNMTSLSFVMIYANQHVLIFLLGWEIAALAAWLLVIWDYRSTKTRFAGFNYLVSTHIGLLFLVAAFMILYTHGGSWELSSFRPWLQSARGAERNVVFLLLLVSFGLKSAFFPFHSWLPRAHAAAPAHVSALMSGVIHKAGLYALVRFVLLIGKPDEWMGWCLIAFSATSAVVGAVYTASQRDLKRLLGYSSTENVGIAGLGIGVGTLGLARQDPTLDAIGFGGGLLHILNHALFKCLLFYAAGSVYRAAHTVDLEKLGGLSRKLPWTSAMFLVGGLAICGLPPLNGFASELLIYMGLFSGGPRLVVVAATLALVGAISALSVTRAFGLAFLGSPRVELHHEPREVGLWMRLPMLAHAAGVVALGVVPWLGLKLVHEPTQLALDLFAPGVDPWVAERALITSVSATSIPLVLLVLLLLGLRRATLPSPGPLHVTWGCGYTAPTPRMQYTGSGFSEQFMRSVGTLVRVVRREELPVGPFPAPSEIKTAAVDAVEHRLYEVLDRGDDTVRGLSQWLGVEQPRIAFGAALASLLVIAIIVTLGGAR